MMYTRTELKNAFFFKLGTQRRVSTFAKLSADEQTIWVEKFHNKYKDNTSDTSTLLPAQSYEKNADFVPEFSEITSIAFGLIEELKAKGPLSVDVTNITGTEKDVLEGFCKILDKVSDKTIGGYNILNYQIPFLVKKLLAHGIKLPFLVNLRNKKPWDISAIDIMRDYQGNMFGDIDLRLVAIQFNVTPSVDGAENELRTALNVAIAMAQK